MTKALVATPFITISKAMASHRAAQGCIYADQIKLSGVDVTVNMTLDRYHPDMNVFDTLYIYHGNDFGGSVNLFGGLKEFPYVDNFVNFSKFKGKVYSLVIPCPDYYTMVQEKVQSAVSKGKDFDPRWNDTDWDNLKRMVSEAEVVDPNLLVTYDKVATGDSHAICMYRPGWMVNSVPFKTLHGALKDGLEKYVLFNDRVPKDLSEIEIYFGNIDLRHHLMRQPDPMEATEELVREYLTQADFLQQLTGAQVTIYELLPIENESRSIPKTGWYKGTPFFGTRQQRDEIRLLFKNELKTQACRRGIKVFEWVSGMINDMGELDTACMEKPQSVHLSRTYYPHWSGCEWNGIDETTLAERKRVIARQGGDSASLENFFS